MSQTPKAPPQDPAAPSPPTGDKNTYKGTLNLPQTPFAMKANLVQNEPASVKRWEKMKLYERVRRARAGREKFVFHDGPPYANGSIHLGHLMNKCLKDFVVRTRTLMGFDCPYIPGWDCHGLPIEHKVMTEQFDGAKGEKLKTLTEDQRRMAVRRECQKYAEKYVKLQSAEMVRLLTLADYEHPYLTMAREFEGGTLEVLADLMDQGLVARALKPVHWSVANETALAEAELEYYDREDLSVYVDFEAADAEKVYDAFGLPGRETNAEGAEEVGETRSEHDQEEGKGDAGPESSKVRVPSPGVRPDISPSFMIWTTTPWTLPANLAIAVNEKFEYALVFVDGNVTVMAKDAVERVTKAAKAETVVVLATTLGKSLVGLRYRHPFVDAARSEGAPNPTPAVFSVVSAEYVTLEDGTGLVHTAPGHGAEDYQTGLKNHLPVYCPVKGDGSYDTTVPAWLRGVNIWKANPTVVDHLRASGHLFYSHTFTHSYPHDWRGKTPVIFRATEQWFVRVDQATVRDRMTLRQMALESTMEPSTERKADRVGFVPDWGRNRLRGMLETRPDWCISRQRSWGLPIPAFGWTDAGGREHTLMTAASVRAVRAVVQEKGSDAWVSMAPAELLKDYDAANDPHAPPEIKSGGVALSALKKGSDILDVWFDSGSTWNAVMRQRGVAYGADDRRPWTDLYLEGSDQHRGWFQSSLLLSLGATGRPPFRTLLTHGFMVDKDGKKMSKSIGNTLNVEDLLKEFGADVCRWWVASLSYENDIKVDREYFGVAGESYRKVRNTLRFMLSNLGDFDAGASRVPAGKYAPTDLDAWILGRYDALADEVSGAYERYDFRAAQLAIYNFCNDTLSSVYLAAIKDRMYCDRPDSPRRRRAQTTLWDLTDGLCRLLAPLLPHTADEAYRALWRAGPDDSDRCVHVQTLVRTFNVKPDARWEKVTAARDRALSAIERTRGGSGAASGTGHAPPENPLDMGVVLPDPDGTLGTFDRTDLADLLGVSRIELDHKATEPSVLDLRAEPRCDRSWKRDGTVKKRSDGGMLSDRDAEALGIL